MRLKYYPKDYWEDKAGIAMNIDFKRTIRKEIKERRASMPFNEVLESSSRIFEAIRNMPEIKSSQKIFCYVSFENEVYTHSFINELLSLKKEVYVPCVDTACKCTMNAVSIESLEELVPGCYGILEPTCTQGKIICPQEIDTIIIPAVAFDKNRYRLGYGGGYYDTYLAQTSDSCYKIGVCFDFQLLDKLPFESHDKQVDIVVTDKTIVF